MTPLEHATAVWRADSSPEALSGAITAYTEELRGDNDRLTSLITESLKAAPVGYIPNHTAENLPKIVRDLAQEVGRQSAELASVQANLGHADEKIGELQDFIRNGSVELSSVKAELNPILAALDDGERTPLEMVAFLWQEAKDMSDFAGRCMDERDRLRAALEEARKLLDEADVYIPNEEDESPLAAVEGPRLRNAIKAALSPEPESEQAEGGAL